MVAHQLLPAIGGVLQVLAAMFGPGLRLAGDVAIVALQVILAAGHLILDVIQTLLDLAAQVFSAATKLFAEIATIGALALFALAFLLVFLSTLPASHP